MGSPATSGFSVSSLIQSLTSSAPSLSSALNSSSVQRALASAPTSDLVQLSEDAQQLQDNNLLFGGPSSAETAPVIPTAVETPAASLEASASGSSDGSSDGSGTPASTASLANQLAGYASDMQSQEMQTLFGLGQTGPPASSVFNELG